jgi:predicted HAD superfamily Cof-like phosphohydrolase
MNTHNDVEEFMRAAGHSVKSDLGPFDQQSAMYFDLVREEYYELSYAFKKFDMVETADACADLIWVIEGLCHSLGIPLQEVWNEVARSNRSKCVEGKLVKREDGKVLKPDTYSPPDIKSIINTPR